MRIGELAAHSRRLHPPSAITSSRGLLTGAAPHRWRQPLPRCQGTVTPADDPQSAEYGLCSGGYSALLRDEQQGVDHERDDHPEWPAGGYRYFIASLQQQRNQLHALRCLLKSSWDKGQCLSDEQSLCAARSISAAAGVRCRAIRTDSGAPPWPPHPQRCGGSAQSHQPPAESVHPPHMVCCWVFFI